MSDERGAVDLGNLSMEEQEALQALQQDPPEGTPADGRQHVLTGFMVLVDYSGNPQVMTIPPSVTDIAVDHEPTTDLVDMACSTIRKDIQAKESAVATAAMMAQQAQAMMQQQQQMMENQRIQQMIQTGGVHG